MNLFRNMKVMNKLLFLISIGLLALLTVSIYGYFSIRTMHDQATLMYKDRLQAVKTLNMARAHYRGIQVYVTELLLDSNGQVDKELLKNINDHEVSITELLNEYKKTDTDTYENKMISKLDSQLRDGSSVRKELIQKISAGQKAAAYTYFKNNYTPIVDAINNTLEKLADYNAKVADDLEKQNTEKFNATGQTMIILCLLALFLSLGSGIYIARLIIKPIRHLEEVMRKAGHGDLTVRETLVSRDEIGELIQVFNDMLEGQGRVVSVVRQASLQLAAASQEMAASSEEVSAHETTISTSVQQVAAEADRGAESVVEASKVLLELSSLIQIAKSKGTSAAGNSQVTMEAAVTGRETVNETVNRMLHIKDKTVETENLIANLSKYSDQIGLITDTITSIASQTNLLALNAAIEAARAGEAGRGFAVVAEEVRELAEQSNQGAGEVAALVREVAAGTAAAVAATQQSRIEVEEGVKSVNEAGQALEHILTAVESTVRDVGGIVDVTNEETATSEKVIDLINTLATVVENTAAHIQQVAASTQQTSAAMETIAASAEQTNSMANELESEVERFTI